MRRMFVVATVMNVMLLGPAHAMVMPMSTLVTNTDPTSEAEMLDGILDATLAARAHTTAVAPGLDRIEIGGVSHPLPPSSLAQMPPASLSDDEAFPALLTVAAEPSTLLLVGTGLAGLAKMVRRRRAKR